VALNTSSIYVGQAVGTSLGGRMLLEGHGNLVGIVAVSLLLGALLCSLSVEWRFRA
jgi:predicted MFS family arabinose efflux permease